jgi:hypothetical protein
MAYSYTQEDGSVATCSLLSSVPSGVEFIEVTSFPEGREFREAWKIEAGALVVDATKKLVVDAKIAKVARNEAVEAIVVTTTSGKAFDGDEVSQGRMARAIAASDAGDTTVWMLADNTPASVTREELKEALRLSGDAQTSLWIV